MRRHLVTDEAGIELGECRVHRVNAPGRCPRLVIDVPDEPEARCYRVHPEDAEGEISILRVRRGDVVGTITLRPVPGSVRARGGSGYARGI